MRIYEYNGMVPEYYTEFIGKIVAQVKYWEVPDDLQCCYSIEFTDGTSIVFYHDYYCGFSSLAD